MELNKINANQVGASQLNEQGRVQKKSVTSKDTQDAASKQSVAPSGDSLQISSEASALAQGLNAVKNSADVRPDRVAELKKAIQAGTYKVDAKKVAEKMLDSSIEESILGKKQK